ncbi:MAG: hypothetical protein DRP84_08215 [Spirochaetes bacterium]|nr:MAG: hypothetical protein DRP84_08215 [Spirochaetota bacterium]
MKINNHFIRTVFPRVGWTTVRCNEFDLDIHYNFKEYIKGIPLNFNEARVFYTVDKNNVSISFLRPALDEYKRIAYFHHTLLIKTKNYRKIGAHPGVFEPVFIKDIKHLTPDSSLDALFIDESMAKQFIKINEGDHSIIKKYFDRTKLFNTLSHLIFGKKLRFEIVGSPSESIKLTYSILKLLPPSLRLVEFVTLPKSLVKKLPQLIIYSGQQERINVMKTTYQLNKKLVEDITNELFKPNYSDFNNLYTIHKKFDDIFDNYDNLPHEDRIMRSISEYGSDNYNETAKIKVEKTKNERENKDDTIGNDMIKQQKIYSQERRKSQQEEYKSLLGNCSPEKWKDLLKNNDITLKELISASQKLGKEKNIREIMKFNVENELRMLLNNNYKKSLFYIYVEQLPYCFDEYPKISKKLLSDYMCKWEETLEQGFMGKKMRIKLSSEYSLKLLESIVSTGFIEKFIKLKTYEVSKDLERFESVIIAIIKKILR